MSQKLSRRELLKALAAATGATVISSVPNKWVTPIVEIGALPAHAQGSNRERIFSTPTTGVDFIVPPGVTQLVVDASGAQGGPGLFDGGSGGQGGRAQFTIAVTPGETLTVCVGGQGSSGFSAAGTNSGGNSTSGDAGGGGGWSGEKRGATMLVVAGGGGGGGSTGGNGGLGGNATGGNGGSVVDGGGGGGGGTQGGGGTVGTGGGGGTDGSSGTGGSGANYGGGFGGGGGGGGYYGGGGGGSGHFGGGGSSYPTSATLTQGVRAGDGQVILTW